MQFERESTPALEEYFNMIGDFAEKNKLPFLRQYGGQIKTVRGKSIWVEGPIGFEDSNTSKLYKTIFNFNGENERDFEHLMVLYNVECDACRLEDWCNRDDNNAGRFMEFRQRVYDKFPVESVNVQSILM